MSKTTRELFYERITDLEKYTNLLYQLSHELNKEIIKWTLNINIDGVFPGVNENILKLKFDKPSPNFVFSIFGGILYFLIYYEALQSNIIRETDVPLEFLQMKTTDIDIDASLRCESSEKYNIQANVDGEICLYENEHISNTEQKKYNTHLITLIGLTVADKFSQSFETINTKTSILRNIQNMLKGKGLKFDYTERSGLKIYFKPLFGPTGGFSLSIKAVEADHIGLSELRPQFNTCLEKGKCDHLLEIIATGGEITKGTMYDLKHTNKKFFGRFIGYSYSRQLLRVYDDAATQYKTDSKNIRLTDSDNESIIKLMAKELRDKPLLYTKYKQGYIRAFTLLQIAYAIKANGGKPAHLLKLFLPDNKRYWTSLLYVYTSRDGPYSDSLKQKGNGLKLNFPKKDGTLDNVIEILEYMMECWKYIDEQLGLDNSPQLITRTIKKPTKSSSISSSTGTLTRLFKKSSTSSSKKSSTRSSKKSSTRSSKKSSTSSSKKSSTSSSKKSSTKMGGKRKYSKRKSKR